MGFALSGTRCEGYGMRIQGVEKKPTMRKVMEMEGKDTIIVRLPNPLSESSI